MWYQLTNKKLFRYKASSNTWERIEDADALAAYEAASNAQDTADGKRRVFVATPYPPYDVGDLWTNGIDLRRCITTRLTGSYNALDWNLATLYDNTKTTIDGGIVTSGRIQLAGDDYNIKAGITGEGTNDSSVRFWAGTDYGNRAIAPFRVLQNGAIYFRQKMVLTDSSNNEQAGMSGPDGSGDTNVRFWAGSNYNDRGGAPFRIYADGTFVSTRGSFGVLQISGNEIRNDLNSDASIILRNDSQNQYSYVGTDVYGSSGGNKGTARFQQGASNSFGWNIGVETRAFGSSQRNVALYVSEGEALINKATLNGRSTEYINIPSGGNVFVDVNRCDSIRATNGSGTSCGLTLSENVNDGKEVTIINGNDSTTFLIYNLKGGAATINAAQARRCIYSSGFWYLENR